MVFKTQVVQMKERERICTAQPGECRLGVDLQ